MRLCTTQLALPLSFGALSTPSLFVRGGTSRSRALPCVASPVRLPLVENRVGSCKVGPCTTALDRFRWGQLWLVSTRSWAQLSPQVGFTISGKPFGFLQDCILDYRLCITIPSFHATVVTEVHVDDDMTEDVTFCRMLFESNLLIASGDLAGLTKDTAVRVK